MSRGESPSPRSVPSKVICDALAPRRGDFSFGDFTHAPPPKSLSKNGFCPKKGVAFLTEDVFEKKFQVRERIPLSELAPARRAAAASEPKAPPCPLTVRAQRLTW
jgi:hypothetical protein